MRAVNDRRHSTAHMSKAMANNNDKIFENMQELMDQMDPQIRADSDAEQKRLDAIKAHYPIMQETDLTQKFQQEARDFEHVMLARRDALANHRLETVIHSWLHAMHNPDTQLNYVRYIKDFKKRGGFLNIAPDEVLFSVETFRSANHVDAAERIMNIPEWSDATKLARVACYQSLCIYLERLSYGWFPRVRPSHMTRSMGKQRNSIALTLTEWENLIHELHKINHRDSLIARCLMEAPNLFAVFSLTIRMIDFATKTINFKRAGKMNNVKQVVYPESFMEELKYYLNETATQRKDSTIVFITRRGKKLARSRCAYVLNKAATTAGIDRQITLPVLRTTWKDLRSQNIDQETILNPIAPRRMAH